MVNLPAPNLNVFGMLADQKLDLNPLGQLVDQYAKKKKSEFIVDGMRTGGYEEAMRRAYQVGDPEQGLKLAEITRKDAALDLDRQRIDIERGRAGDARRMLELERRAKEDELGYRGTQRRINERAAETEDLFKRRQMEEIGKKAVDPITEMFLREMNPQGAPGTPRTGTAPGGPAGPISADGQSPGGPVDGQMPSVPGVVVAPPRAGVPPAVQPTQGDPIPAPRPAPNAPQGDDPILNTPFGPRRASQLQRMEMLLRLGGKQDAAEQIKNIREGGRKLRPEDMKQIDEADDQVFAAQGTLNNLKRAKTLNQPNRAYDGVGAEERAWLVNNTPIGSLPLVDDKRGIDTKEFGTLTKDLALSQLKSIFGAAPTEGERKILMEVQGAVNEPRDVRERILRKAEIFANRRLEYNKLKAAAVRDGSYWLPNGQINLPPDPTDEELERLINPKADPKAQKPEGPQRAPGTPIGRQPSSQPRAQQDPTIQPLPKEQRADWPKPNRDHVDALLRTPTPELKEYFKQKFGPDALRDALRGRE